MLDALGHRLQAPLALLVTKPHRSENFVDAPAVIAHAALIESDLGIRHIQDASPADPIIDLLDHHARHSVSAIESRSSRGKASYASIALRYQVAPFLDSCAFAVVEVIKVIRMKNLTIGRIGFSLRC